MMLDFSFIEIWLKMGLNSTIPAAFTYKIGKAHWHTLVRARAIETGYFCLRSAVLEIGAEKLLAIH